MATLWMFYVYVVGPRPGGRQPGKALFAVTSRRPQWFGGLLANRFRLLPLAPGAPWRSGFPPMAAVATAPLRCPAGFRWTPGCSTGGPRTENFGAPAGAG